MSDVLGTAGYGTNAAALAQQYESLQFTDVHRDVLHCFPPPPARVLDIGAGSGRDAAALAALGHRVMAVEPTHALRMEGMRRHAAWPIEWVDDHLPALQRIRASGGRHDLVLLTAVWMHLDTGERDVAMAAVVELLAECGQVVMSLRHGPVPPGRRMFDVSAQETVRLAEAHGLALRFLCEREDMLDRGDVTWSFLVLQARAAPV
ncbi:methyltransferase domain-containing protein [Variovorax sp. H27-G14]|uniref:class I SAM-dependent methyltransferase n=1 Tax=Variovorax sp. H27-G14 TaxID=3111914 RepID=UPI0038FD2613